MTVSAPRPSSERFGTLFASYAGFTILAWYLNAMGAVLPPLRDEVGEWAGVYALLLGPRCSRGAC